MKLNTSTDGLKKIELALLSVALILVPLGAIGIKDAMASGDTTQYLMGFGTLGIGLVSAGLYTYVEAKSPKVAKKVKKEEEDEVNGDVEAAIKETTPKESKDEEKEEEPKVEKEEKVEEKKEEPKVEEKEEKVEEPKVEEKKVAKPIEERLAALRQKAKERKNKKK